MTKAPNGTKKKVFITGVTGTVGKALAAELTRRNYEFVGLSRTPGKTAATGDPASPGPWQQAMLACDAVVHLAGESVFGKRWTDEQKDRLWKSRVDSTRLIADTLAKAPATARPKVLVSASAIGYYGLRRDEEVSESAPPGDDFLARLSVAWEEASRPAAAAGLRTVTVRVGVVLAKGEGALKTMVPPFQMGLGGPVGDGRQWVSWIHLADLVAILARALEDEVLSGIYNGTAPGPVTNAVFSQALAKVLHRPCLFPVPKVALRVLFGEVAEVMAGGQRVLPTRLLAHGFRFAHPDCEAALREALARR